MQYFVAIRAKNAIVNGDHNSVGVKPYCKIKRDTKKDSFDLITIYEVPRLICDTFFFARVVRRFIVVIVILCVCCNLARIVAVVGYFFGCFFFHLPASLYVLDALG